MGRSLTSIPAGMQNMSIITFLALTTAGSTIWNTILIPAGFCLGENWSILETRLGCFQPLVIVAERTDATGERAEGSAGHDEA